MRYGRPGGYLSYGSERKSCVACHDPWRIYATATPNHTELCLGAQNGLPILIVVKWVGTLTWGGSVEHVAPLATPADGAASSNSARKSEAAEIVAASPVRCLWEFATVKAEALSRLAYNR